MSQFSDLDARGLLFFAMLLCVTGIALVMCWAIKQYRNWNIIKYSEIYRERVTPDFRTRL